MKYLLLSICLLGCNETLVDEDVIDQTVTEKEAAPPDDWAPTNPNMSDCYFKYSNSYSLPAFCQPSYMEKGRPPENIQKPMMEEIWGKKNAI